MKTYKLIASLFYEFANISGDFNTIVQKLALHGFSESCIVLAVSEDLVTFRFLDEKDEEFEAIVKAAKIEFEKREKEEELKNIERIKLENERLEKLALEKKEQLFLKLAKELGKEIK